jgi:nitrogen fixation/metabolism regulation signal transduction histidine kinase
LSTPNPNTGKPIGKILSERKTKALLLVCVLIIIWAIVIHFASSFIRDNSEREWETISRESNGKNRELCVSMFDQYQNSLLQLSNELTESPDIRRNLGRNDSKKLFEEFLNLKLDNSLQVEAYNSKLELLAFAGRRLDSDIYSLQRALKGNKFSVIKEIGFFSYLIIYSPVLSSKDTADVSGVLLCAKLLDVKNQIGKKFLQTEGMIKEIGRKIQSEPVLIPADVISGRIGFDSVTYADGIQIDLPGIDKAVIGKLFLNDYSKLVHIQGIETLEKKIISALVFGFTAIFFLLCLSISRAIPSRLPKFALFIAVLTLTRYLWLKYSFPSAILAIEIFSPADYASTFGYGIARSLGDLFITSSFILLISLYGFFITVKGSSYTSLISQKETKISAILKIIASVALFFLILNLFGIIIQSIVYDSNLQFFDKANVVPESSLFTLNFALLIFAFSMFLFLVSLVIIGSRKLVANVFSEYKYRKYSFIILLGAILLVNFLVAGFFKDFNLDGIYRFIIIILSFTFGIYLSSKLYLSKSYNVFSIRNFSIIVIFCLVTVPGILLDKITSQETHFVELIGGRISEKEDDRVRYLLITELSRLAESRRLESELNDKSKQQELAFSVWSDSKLSEESFNTAVIITDTNRRKKSDFIFGPANLQTDSVLAFAEKSFFKKKNPLQLSDSLLALDSLAADEEEAEEFEYESEEPENIFETDKITVLKNDIEKYYLGIVPLEILNLRGTTFETKLGYLMTAVEYESKNYLLQSSTQLFRNYSGDKLFDKLISTPVITEYVGGEIEGSTNRDLSKENTISLNAFRESVKNKPDKSGWRYETINNEKYRTYYIQAAPEELTLDERIFAISLKRNDIKLIIFFYLKFILFTVVIYIAVLAVIALVMLTRIKSLRFNFREKLFSSFFIVSVIPIILLAIYTRSFIKNKYDSNFQNQIISDLNLVSQSLKSAQTGIGRLDSLGVESGTIMTKSIQQSDKNFNLFSKYKLVSTTDEELYKSDMLDTRADADAYYNVYVMKKDFYSKTKELGPYSFIVGYRPLFDSRNTLIGLISSQTVYKQNLMNEELTEILTFIFGTYFIVIILLLIFVTFMTDRISKPILSLQLATEKIAKGESNIALEINSNDELGKLVQSFNKMTSELEISKQKLKKIEREAAWRDIARRVAHEIKNPLTPMKLSIQHLYDMYASPGKEDFENSLKKTRDIIIKEIDKLNRIATEFSDFAKLPGKDYESTDLNEVIEEVVSLYSRSKDITFLRSLDPLIERIWADKQELNRVFQNLIKNSIQAIDEKGEIQVKTYRSNGRIVAEIIDNGCGIDPEIMAHLFEPNFSTKSTGMGLGLAITKKSLDEMKAEIKFQSNNGKGTIALIKFIPLNGNNG